MTTIGDVAVTRGGTLNPSAFPDEWFELYSIPAHDRGGPEVTRGSEIGSAKQIVQPGDVMISKIIPHIRRARVVGPTNGLRQIASGEWIILRSRTFDADYVRHYLLSDGFHQEFMNTVAGVGGSLVRARPAQVKAIKLPLPPPAEQRRIAAILDHTDALRAKRRQVLAHLDSLTQAIFHDMFGEAMSPRVALGDRLDFLTSGSRGWARYYADEGEQFIRIQNVGRGELRLNDMAYVNAPTTAEARRTLVQAGDVLLSITADLGRTAVITEELGHAYISQHLAILRAPSFVPEFLSAYLQSPDGQRQIMKKDRGATKAGLNFNDVRSIVAPAPSRAMQHQFAARVAAVSSQRLVVRRMLTADDELFASLQARAFRGEP